MLKIRRAGEFVGDTINVLNQNTEGFYTSVMVLNSWKGLCNIHFEKLWKKLLFNFVSDNTAILWWVCVLLKIYFLITVCLGRFSGFLESSLKCANQSVHFSAQL